MRFLYTEDMSGYDVIGDVHACAVELVALVDALGYQSTKAGWFHPEGREMVFLGDLVDRGPSNVEVLTLVMQLIEAGTAHLGAIGNHDYRLWQYLLSDELPARRGGLPDTLAEFAMHDCIYPGALEDITDTIDRLFRSAPPWSTYDNGGLVVTHAALRARSGETDDLTARNGESDGDTDVQGRPIRTFDWMRSWHDRSATVVFGHNVCGEVPKLYHSGNVVGIDTGCVFGGALSAYRYPQGTCVSVAALRAYTTDTPVQVDPHLRSRIPSDLDLITCKLGEME